MRVLLLTHYFPPDLSACAFRAGPLADALTERLMATGGHLDVLTTRPTRYRSFETTAPDRENRPGVTIERLPLPAHRSGMVDQSLAFASFARQVRARVHGRRYDVVAATSSRLMTAVLGAWVARATGARLWLDLRDIFVDGLQDVAPRFVSMPLTPMLSAAERWAVHRADAVNLVSRGFAGYFEARYPGRTFTYLTNGIDAEFLTPVPQETRPREGRPLELVYAGNLGEGQGLHAVVPDLASQLGATAHVTVIGDGGRREALAAALTARGVTNVTLRPPMARAALQDYYRAADVLFLHLNDYPAFRKVLPSKVFEYAALGKPILAGVAGYAATFLRDEVPNAAVFAPCDAAGAVQALAALTLSTTPRPSFLARYDRRAISGALAEDILRVATR